MDKTTETEPTAEEAIISREIETLEIVETVFSVPAGEVAWPSGRCNYEQCHCLGHTTPAERLNMRTIAPLSIE